MKKVFTPFLIAISLLLSLTTYAQDGTNDPTFNPSDIGFGEGANARVLSTTIQTDGKIIIGGYFTSYNGTVMNSIARLNADGTLDASFTPGSGANNYVYTTALQSGEKIIIGGKFTSYNGTSSNHLARLNADGTLDATFNTGTGVNNDVYTTRILSEGKILIGGSFTSYNGATRKGIARLNADGTLDATFNSAGVGANGFIYSMAIRSDGKIIIAGNFTSYNGITANRIACLNADGTLDATFNSTGTGANGFIYSTIIQSDGKIIIGGAFTTYNSSVQYRIVRLNADGKLDASFTTGAGANAEVRTISVQKDGKVIIGGNFTSYNGSPRNHVARLDADGTLDANFTTVPGVDVANSFVFTTTVLSDEKIMIGGDFRGNSGAARNYLAILNTDGSLDPNFIVKTGADGQVMTMSIQNDKKVLIGGAFASYNGAAVRGIARLNIDGSLDASLTTGTGTNDYVLSVAQSDGKIIIGGSFTSYNGTTINRIARLDENGSLDVTFNVGTGANGTISTTAISDKKIIIGGSFTSYNGTATNRIARLNTDGSLDGSFINGTGANNTVYCMAVQRDGKLIIGGAFTSYNGAPSNHLVRLNADGTLDATFTIGTGVNSDVRAIGIQADGKIIIGGFFTSYNGSSINHIARLNMDGSLDDTFIIGTGANNNVYSIGIQSDGKIIIGGAFTSYSGTARNTIARLNPNGSLDGDFTRGTSAKNIVHATVVQSDGKILIGGDFTSYDGIGRNRIARVNAIALPCIDSGAPTASASSMANCGTKSTTLNIASGTLNSAAAWQWYSSSCGGTAVGFGTSIIVSPTVTTTYYVRGEGGCVKPGTCASITITVNPLPSVTANATVSTLCAGASTTLTGGGALTYVWSGGVSDGIGFNPSFTRTYTVVGTDVNSCTNTATKIITVNPLPPATTTLSGTVITANQTGAAYQWLDCNLNNASIASATNQSYTATKNGDYSVLVTMNGCSATSACVNVTITAMDENKKDNHEPDLYPNPSNGVFTVHSTRDGLYSMVNELGQTVQVIELNDSNNYTKNIESLSPGIYFIVGFTKIEMTSRKIMVTN